MPLNTWRIQTRLLAKCLITLFIEIKRAIKRKRKMLPFWVSIPMLIRMRKSACQPTIHDAAC